MATRTTHVEAAEATARLGVKPATLYSYVSRGLVRTDASPHDRRSRVYRVDDLDALVARRAQRRPAVAAAHALDFGMPVLETRVSSIADGALRYRGADAVELAQSATLEDVARRLWELPGDAPIRFVAPRAVTRVRTEPGIDSAIARLGAAVGRDDAAWRDGPPQAVGIVAAVAGAQAALDRSGAPLHARLARAWRRPSAGDAIRRALVLVADHELNASTFAVRVVASTGAGLTACLLAGLAALSGPRHGGMTTRVRSLVEDFARDPRPGRHVDERLAGEGLAGFGHPLYPDGDPRAVALFPSARDAATTRLCRLARARGAPAPTIDVALVALERAHRLPRGAALALFAIGRSVGWIAHALEQRAGGRLIRPRSRFVG